MDLLQILLADGVVKSPGATLTPLTGGVSSEIYRVNDGDAVFVVKRALAKLKVRQDWFADVGRNANEYRYLEYAGQWVKGMTPRPLRLSEEHGYFTMEYLGDGFANWKQQMLAGECDQMTAQRVGALLGILHQQSAADPAVAGRFATLPWFEQLRIDPYLLATAKRHPDLASLFDDEADRLRASKRVLTHGDFSPKNILVSEDRVVIVDCEVAWYGDAAFDAAFLMNHLLLKSFARPDHAKTLQDMTCTFWETYRKAAGPAGGTEADVVRLLFMLMLARVDGKSPVEYLDDRQRLAVRVFAVDRLKAARWTISAIWP